MKINSNLKNFKKNHQKNTNQVIFHKSKSSNKNIFLNLINNVLIKKNSFIFESVEKGKIRGRYTILGLNPDKIWELNNNQITLIKRKKRVRIRKKPYTFLKKLVNDFHFSAHKELPPMYSLLVGYFSYDIIRYIEKIPNESIDNLKIPDVKLMRPKNIIIHDNIKKNTFYIYNAFADEKIKNYTKYFLNLKRELESLKKFSFTKIKNHKIFRNKNTIKIKSNVSKKTFLNMIKKAKNYIYKGDIFQVVLSQRFETKLNKSPLEIYKKLRIINPSPFMFYFNFNNFQILGSSPEILVRLRNGKITIRPIAGTRPRGNNKIQDKYFKNELLNDRKELAEHLMLLDLGRNDVGKVSKIGTVNVTEQF